MYIAKDKAGKKSATVDIPANKVDRIKEGFSLRIIVVMIKPYRGDC